MFLFCDNLNNQIGWLVFWKKEEKYFVAMETQHTKHIKLINPTCSQTHVPVHPCAGTGNMEQWEELPRGLRGSLKLVSVTFIHSMQELIKIINQAQIYPKISIQLCSILLNHNHNSIDYVASCSDMITLLLAVMIYHPRVKLSKHLSLGRNLLFRLLKNVPLTQK